MIDAAPKVRADRIERLARLQAQVVMPVIRTGEPAAALAVARALVAGGLSVLEVAWNCADAAAVLQEISSWPGVTVGAGTIVDRQTATAALAAGAAFLVTPITIPDLVPLAHAAGVPIALGACTPTEVWQAHTAGSDLIKLFPIASMGGPQLLKDLREPFGDLPWLVSGSVTLANADEYRRLGARVLALGGALLPKAAVAKGDWAAIQANAEAWRHWVTAAAT